MLARAAGIALVLYGGWMVVQQASLAALKSRWDQAAPEDAAVDVLARTIWGEARGEGRDGMIAVANVVVNRANAGGWWGNSIREVCLKPWQFSAWNPTDPNLIRMLKVDDTDPQFADALQIAAAAVAGRLPDITGGATNYQVRGTGAAWAAGMQQTAAIGAHDFYREA